MIKHWFVSLSLLLIFAGTAGAQDWWRGTLGPAPPTPPSSSGNSDTRSSSGSYRREPREPRQPREPSVQRPKPPSKAELRQQEQYRQRQAAQRQLIQGELTRLAGSFQVQRIQPTMELRPHSDGAFEIAPDSGPPPFGAILAAPLAGLGTPPSRIPVENLRRAAALLDPIVQAFRRPDLNGMSEEDMSFLASQSALAMEGAQLSVKIVDAPAGREEQTRQLAQQAKDIETARTEAQQATTERLHIEERLVRLQEELTAGKGDTKALSSERETLLVRYKSAWTVENDKKNTEKNMTGKVTVIWEGPAPSRK
jgi:hypothetical protein